MVDSVTNDDVNNYAARNVNCSRIIPFKMEFVFKKRYIINKLSISYLIGLIVKRLVNIDISYAPYSTLRVSYDTLILKYPLDVTQCVRSGYCSSNVCMYHVSSTLILLN